jgi:fatty-acyl-CoA synthase
MTADRRGEDLWTSLHAGAEATQAILQSILRYRDRPAVADDRLSWTYAELGEAVGRTLAVLKAVGLRSGATVATLSGNRAELVACRIACGLLGLRTTSLHPLAAEDTHAFVLQDAEVDVLIVDADGYGEQGRSLALRVPRLGRLLSLGPVEGAIDLVEAMARATPAPLVDESRPGDGGTIAYTGGTNGQPKGVISSGGLSALWNYATQWDWPDEIRFLAATPVSHASGAAIVPVLLQGGLLRLTRSFDAADFCRIVEAERITAAMLVPTMIYALLDSPAREAHDLTSLRTLIYGASPIAPERLAQALGIFGPIFVQYYGQTEAPGVATLRKADHDLARPDRLGSCGLPSPLVTVKLFDEHMNEVTEPGQRGEICVRGPIVMRGYWRRPEATEEAFRGGWLHTGDIAVRDAEGYLTIVDRSKEMIVTGGFNVYPREVEDALLSHPAVAAAGVVGLPDPKWGEAVTAYVAPRPGADVAAAALMEHVRLKRGRIWAPKSVIFVKDVPLTSLGKVDRKALRDGRWDPVEPQAG